MLPVAADVGDVAEAAPDGFRRVYGVAVGAAHPGIADRCGTSSSAAARTATTCAGHGRRRRGHAAARSTVACAAEYLRAWTAERPGSEEVVAGRVPACRQRIRRGWAARAMSRVQRRLRAVTPPAGFAAIGANLRTALAST